VISLDLAAVTDVDGGDLTAPLEPRCRGGSRRRTTSPGRPFGAVSENGLFLLSTVVAITTNGSSQMGMLIPRLVIEASSSEMWVVLLFEVDM